MRIVALLFAFVVLLGSQARAGDDVAAAQSRHPLSGRGLCPRRCGSRLCLCRAGNPRDCTRRPTPSSAWSRHSYAPVYRHKSFEFGEARAADGKIAQQVHIVDADGVPWEALYTLEEQGDGSLKISGCALIKTGQGV